MTIQPIPSVRLYELARECGARPTHTNGLAFSPHAWHEFARRVAGVIEHGAYAARQQAEGLLALREREGGLQ